MTTLAVVVLAMVQAQAVATLVALTTTATTTENKKFFLLIVFFTIIFLNLFHTVFTACNHLFTYL